MLRALHINDYPADPPFGGAEVVMARTMALLREAGCQVDAFTARDLEGTRRTAARYVHNTDAARALEGKLEAFQPDVVHLHNFYHVLSPAILGTLQAQRRRHALRVVMTAHDHHLVCPNAGGTVYRGRRRSSQPIDPGKVQSLFYVLRQRWDRRGPAYSLLKLLQHLWHYRCHRRARLPDVVLCPSRWLQELLRPLVRQTLFLPHPTPALPELRSARPPHLRMAYCGRLEREKGLEEFLDTALGALQGTLVIVGDGAERTRLERLVAGHGCQDRVSFLGRLPHAQALKEILGSHVLVSPSRCLESYGLTLIEALLLGTNVLASDRGALREIVKSVGVGYLFDPDDPASLVQQLQTIASDFRSGRLNTFDVRAFLAERSEERYLQRLLLAYRGETRAAERS